MNNTYDWLLFDADNTLLDFEATQEFGLQEMFKDIGIPYQESYMETYKVVNTAYWSAYEDGKIDKETLKVRRFGEFFQRLGVEVSPEECSKSYRKHIANTDFLLEGAIELLDLAKAHHRLALVTNGLADVQRPRLRKSGIYDYFEVIVVSDEIGLAKPDRAFFEYCFAEMQTTKPHEHLMVGDNLKADIGGAQAFGMETCWMNVRRKANETAVKPTFEVQQLKELQERLF
ncbi:MAG: YjjG family noncanonical pyrimidine nucleotidase [Bacteroidota bacterium]